MTMDLHEMFDVYNVIYFEGKLKVSDIVMADIIDAFGYTIQENKKDSFIIIAKGMSNSDTASTLLHEMIHVEQIRRGKKMSHGKFFKKMAKIICESEELSYKKF